MPSAYRHIRIEAGLFIYPYIITVRISSVYIFLKKYELAFIQGISGCECSRGRGILSWGILSWGRGIYHSILGKISLLLFKGFVAVNVVGEGHSVLGKGILSWGR